MPVIVVTSSKGGAGKSTDTMVLGQTLAAAGAGVTLIDADPNRPLVRWRAGSSALALDVIGDCNESTIIQTIRRERARQPFVFVDIEGAPSRLISRAISQADLVLIPLQMSALDAVEAGKVVSLIREEEEALGDRQIPFRLLFTRTSPLIQTRIEKEIVAAMAETEMQALKAHLHDRQAYKAIWSRRVAIHELDKREVNGIPEAIKNAAQVADELVNILLPAERKVA